MARESNNPEEGVDAGWAWVALVSAILIIGVTSTTMCMYGVLYIELLRKFSEDRSKTALVGALATSFFCLLSPIATVFIKRYGSRMSIFSGAIISGIGFGLTCFVTSLDAVIVTAGAVTGVGYAFIFTGTIVNITYYFKRWRHLTVASLYATIGLGMFMSAPCGFYLLDVYGLNSTFLILAAMHIQMCVCAAISRPSLLELKSMDTKDTKVFESKQELKSAHSVFDFRIFKNLDLILFLVSTLAWNFAYSVGHQHLPNYLSVNNADVNDISLVYSAFAVSNTAGRLVGMFISARNTVSPLLASNKSELVCGFATLLFVFYAKWPLGRVIFAVQLGLFMGLPNCTMMAIAMTMAEEDLLSETICLVNLACGLGIGLGPYIAGFIYDVSGSYTYTFITAGIVLVVGWAVGMVCYVRRRQEAQQTTKELKVEQRDEALQKLTAPVDNDTIV